MDFGPITLIGAAPDRNFADLDLARLPDGRFLAVMREMVTRQSHQAWSADEGATWTPVQPTGFRGSNTKLFRLRNGSIACAYRDEDPDRRGVSLSVTDDGGEHWRFAGQLYAAGPDARHLPGSVCGYPDVVDLGDGRLAAVLHTYPDDAGRMDIQLLFLRDLLVGAAVRRAAGAPRRCRPRPGSLLAPVRGRGRRRRTVHRLDRRPERLAVVAHPVVDDVQVRAHAEVLDAHLEEARRVLRVVQLRARRDAGLDAALEDVALHAPDVGVVPLAGPADAHRVVGRAPLDHVDAGHGEDLVELLHRRRLLDHDRRRRCRRGRRCSCGVPAWSMSADAPVGDAVDAVDARARRRGRP